MMCAQRNQQASITGLEIDENAMIDASYNIKNCPWPNRIQLINGSLQDYQPDIQFDLIVSNPPFFENSLKSNNQSKKTARHTDTLHYKDILAFAEEHLSATGHLSIILPIENGTICIDEAKNYHLHLKRKCLVQPVPHKKPHRIVFELSKSKNEVIEEELIIETGKRHDYSEDYVALTNMFYTIM